MSEVAAAAPVVRLERHGNVAVLVIDNPPVNATSRVVRAGLLEAVHAVDADAALAGAVICGAGKTFVAGADIREFGRPIEEPSLPAVVAAILASGKPFVAAVNGAALGGGFELALACDARVASREAIVGLPEVSLGIIPGAGGTQHLPRLVGIAAAIEIICSGRRIRAEEALRLRLVDRIAENACAEAIELVRSMHGLKQRVSERAVRREDDAKVEEAAQAALKAGRKRPQIVAAIESIRRAGTEPYPEAIAAERETFNRLRESTEAAALRYLFFAEREAAKVPDLEGIEARPVARVAIIGAGTMGVGIAIAFADAGYEVTLTDRDEPSVKRGLERVRKNYDGSVSSGRIGEDEARRRLARILAASGLAAASGADLVIEAVFEDMGLKKEVFAQLDRIARPGAILATNTSYLDVDEIAQATARPGDVLGMHFFSPAHVMRLLEVVRGKNTSREALATALAVGRGIRKLPVIARVGDGFIGNRIYAAYRRQAELMVEEGAMPEEVDAAIEAFGFAMGPFAVSDLAGLDIAWRNRQRLAPTRDPRARYVEIADRLCEQGRFGQKTGAGWYRYEPGARRGTPDPEVRAMIEEHSKRKGIARRPFTREEIQWRALATMVNEAALLLGEGVAQRPSDVDLVLVNGYGFPKHEGGPLFWASRQDRARLERELDALGQATGHGFQRGDIDAALALPFRG
ncbi:MAG TPA: 3-hydroxyacyl-CoA dehydrogenase NAD-binding domain-containing protein [Usitatibacter sp.]|nr:3-hydroxyacyl-CoA dehydrogenase NAD-binding domain-containing protein [Usitatibacter sp.]